MLKKLRGSRGDSSDRKVNQLRKLNSSSIGPIVHQRSVDNPKLKYRKFITPEPTLDPDRRNPSSKVPRTEFPKLKFIDASFRVRPTAITPVSESFNIARPPVSSLRSQVTASTSPSHKKSARAVLDISKLITPRPPNGPRPPQMTPTSKAGGG